MLDQKKILMLCYYSIDERVLLFLKTRNLALQVYSDTRSILKEAADSPGSFVFLSAHYPIENLATLEGLLQKYDSKVIYFSEDDSALGAARLSHIQSKHKLHGHLSGPAIERALIHFTKNPRMMESLAPLSLTAQSGNQLSKVFTLIQRRTSDILDGAVHLTTRRIEAIENVHCYCVWLEDSEQMYILGTTDRNHLIQSQLELIIETIRKTLKEQGFRIIDEAIFTAKTSQFPFQTWLLRKKAMSFLAYNRGHEWRIGWLSNSESPIEVENSPPGMIQIPLRELRSRRKFDFTLYARFENPLRYVVLVPPHSALSESTRCALLRCQIDSLYAQHEDRHKSRRILFEQQIEQECADLREQTAS